MALSPLELSFTGLVSDCTLTRDVVLRPSGAAIDSSLFSFSLNTVDKLTINTSSASKEGVYNLQYRAYYSDPATADVIDFDVTVTASTCNKVWRYSGDGSTFNKIYYAGSPIELVRFDDVDISNCPFIQQLFDVSTGTEQPIDSSIFTFTQAQTSQDPSDSLLVSVDSWGKLNAFVADHNDGSAVGTYTFRLKTISQRFVGDSESQ